MTTAGQVPIRAPCNARVRHFPGDRQNTTLRFAGRVTLSTINSTREYNSPGCHATFATMRSVCFSGIRTPPQQRLLTCMKQGPQPANQQHVADMLGSERVSCFSLVVGARKKGLAWGSCQRQASWIPFANWSAPAQKVTVSASPIASPTADIPDTATSRSFPVSRQYRGIHRSFSL